MTGSDSVSPRHMDKTSESPRFITETSPTSMKEQTYASSKNINASSKNIHKQVPSTHNLEIVEGCMDIKIPSKKASALNLDLN